MTTVFYLSKAHQSNHVEAVPIFHPSKLNQKITSELLARQITLKKVHRNDVDFLSCETTSNKTR